VIKRYQKQLASLHGLQQSPARFDPGDRLAQRGGKAVKDGGAQHELNSVAPKTTEQFGKVRADRPYRAGQSLHVHGKILLKLGRGHRNDTEDGRPTFCLAMKPVQLCGIQRTDGLLLEKSPCLLEVKAQG
jgi:hypothetical protein